MPPEWHAQERHLLTLESPFSRLWTQRVRVDPLGASTQVHVSIIDTEENRLQSDVGTLNPSLAWLINPHREQTYQCQACTAPVATLSVYPDVLYLCLIH